MLVQILVGYLFWHHPNYKNILVAIGHFITTRQKHQKTIVQGVFAHYLLLLVMSAETRLRTKWTPRFHQQRVPKPVRCRSASGGTYHNQYPSHACRARITLRLQAATPASSLVHLGCSTMNETVWACDFVGLINPLSFTTWPSSCDAIGIISATSACATDACSVWRTALHLACTGITPWPTQPINRGHASSTPCLMLVQAWNDSWLCRVPVRGRWPPCYTAWKTNRCFPNIALNVHSVKVTKGKFDHRATKKGGNKCRVGGGGVFMVDGLDYCLAGIYSQSPGCHVPSNRFVLLLSCYWALVYWLSRRTEPTRLPCRWWFGGASKDSARWLSGSAPLPPLRVP